MGRYTESQFLSEIWSTEPEGTDDQPFSSIFYCVLGIVASTVLTTIGAAYGTAKASVGICAMSINHPELMMKGIIPVVMAGIIAIYGLVVAVLLAGSMTKIYSSYKAFMNLGAGLAVGISGLAAGWAIGTVGDAGIRAAAEQPRLFVGLILILIFAEVLGLYGLIIAIYLFTK